MKPTHRSMAQSHAAMFIANAQANIRRVDRAIEGPHLYGGHTVIVRGRERWDTSLPAEPLTDTDLAARLRSLREERKVYERQIEQMREEFGMEDTQCD